MIPIYYRLFHLAYHNSSHRQNVIKWDVPFDVTEFIYFALEKLCFKSESMERKGIFDHYIFWKITLMMLSEWLTWRNWHNRIFFFLLLSILIFFHFNVYELVSRLYCEYSKWKKVLLFSPVCVIWDVLFEFDYDFHIKKKNCFLHCDEAELVNIFLWCITICCLSFVLPLTVG